MLCLRGWQGEDITIIGELKNLEILDLACSSIKELPKEIAQLTRLRLLDLSWCSGLKIIPPNVLSSLSKSEELHMEGSFAEWENDGVVGNKRRNARLDELNNLPHLTTLYAHIPNAQMISKHIFIETLDRYKIFVGDDHFAWIWNLKYEYSRTLKLKIYTNIYSDNLVKMLLKKTEDLYLNLKGLEGIRSVLAELNNGVDFSNLKRVDVIITIKDYSTNSEPLPFFNKQTCHWISNLRRLIINGCGNFEHLLSPSAARSLVQLQRFDIADCTCLREMIFTEEIKEEERKDVICFPRLNSLRIGNLPNLIFFCSGNYNIEFSLLKELEIGGCPRLKAFISQTSNQSGMHTLFSQVAVPSLETMRIFQLSNVKMIIHNELPPDSFQNLRNLSVSCCKSLKNLFPATIAKHLPQLKDLSIRNCQCLREIIFTEEIEGEGKDVICFPRLNSLRMDCLRKLIFFCSGNYNIEFHLLKELEIKDCPKLKEFISESSTEFGMHTLFNEKVAIPSLKRMIIFRLRNAKKIFHNELAPDSFCQLEEMVVEDCDELLAIFSSTMVGVFNYLQEHVDRQGQGIRSFQNLRKLRVSRCESLKNLFPASIAKHLQQLEDLSIRSCGVEEIVSEGEGVEEQPVRFEFPKVSSLVVENLKKLKCFYKGQHTIVWPMLKELSTDCSALLMIVGLEDVRIQETKGKGEAALLVEEVFPNLQQLELRDISDVDQFPPDLFHHVKVFKVEGGYHGGSSSIFSFLRSFYNLERLEIFSFNFEDVIVYKGDIGTLSTIKNLKLDSSINLKHIWRKDSEFGHIISNLQILRVWFCDDFLNIGASSVSFQNLTTLEVSYCKMTPFVVENLVQLTTMRVSHCIEMTEIVANEGDYHQTIVVSKLKCLLLSNLQSLTSFCSGSYTFSFPCLDFLSTPQLQRVIKQETYYQNEYWTGDLNTTIQQLCTKKGGSNGLPNLIISDTFPNLIEIWKRNPQKFLELQNLRKMEFYKCSSLKYIFTSSMLLSLDHLGTIKVKECSIMEQVIREDEKEATTHEFTFPKLSCIEIKSCSNLTNVYLGSRPLEFPRLGGVKIADCPKMRTFSSTISRKNEKAIGEQDVVIPNLKRLTLSSIDIHMLWHHPSFSSLTHLCRLRVEGCHNLKYLFPSFLLKDLVLLRFLEIKDCNMMEQVIFTDGLGAEDHWRNHTILLESLSLKDLPKLKDICFENYLEFPWLRDLTLKNCPLLKTFISKSVSGDEPPIHQPTQTNNSAVLNEKVVFPRLEELLIQDCESLEEIIELQGLIANESQSTVTTKFVFPHVTHLGLGKLPRLESFFSRMHTTQWPLLKQMEVIECPKARIFGEVQISNQQPLFCVNEDTFPVLEELTLKTSDMIKGICDGQLSLQCFPNLKLLNLQFFPQTSTTLPYSFIRSLPNLLCFLSKI
ncbi:hypothetical protein PVK06_036990 [Gossypium arboreum]|uniref:Disease resistance protein At4g27190-like leucine-rich repeats domain-containing protein n=2 Tax=Gossypium arboreum TaxID=29729 RepID=A0ABR0NL18_GOSAR|nr:hypothetical protein PVK06_036990 [Gossypium arboreum]